MSALSPLRRFIQWVGRPSVMFALTVTALVVVAVTFTQTHVGQQLDLRAYTSISQDARSWAQVVDPLVYISFASVGLATSALVVAACLRGRADLAISAVVLIAGANVTTQVLKHGIVYHPAVHLPSLPSGHSTVGASLSVAALMVASRTVRPVVVPVAGFVTTFVGAGTYVGRWHKPSDVIAALAVVLAWTAVAIWLSQRLTRGRHTQTPSRRDTVFNATVPLGASGVVGVAFLLLGVRPAAGGLTETALTLLTLGAAGALTVGWAAQSLDAYLPAVVERDLPDASAAQLRMFFLASAGLGVVACLRVSSLGTSISQLHRVVLGGTSHDIDAVGWFVSLMPSLAVLTVVALVGLIVHPFTRRRALFALLLLLLVNVAVQVLKKLLAATLLGAHATLPSGHAALGLTVAAAIVVMAPQTRRKLFLAAAGFIASVGTVGVIVARTHSPDDSLASAALLLACASLMAWGVPYALPAPGKQVGTPPARRHLLLPLVLGAYAWVLLLLFIGIHPLWDSARHGLTGLGILLLWPAVAAWVLTALERVVSTARGRRRLG